VLKIKVLKGPGAGQSFVLKQGENVVGRSAQCDIIFNSTGVSKSHAKLVVQGDQCVVTDTNSSNGTYVNGGKVKDRILRIGDKIAFHEIIVELGVAQEPKVTMQEQPPPMWNNNMPVQPQAFPQQFAQPQAGMPANPQSQMPMQMQSPMPANMQGEPESLLDLGRTYVEKVVLPGVYRLAEWYPMKTVVAILLFAFILMVTFLSSIPMAELTKDGIQKEAQRRALTIARQLAEVTERTLASGGGEAGIRTDFAENEDGVESALVVAREDGHIMAPLTKQDSYSSDNFVARARKFDDARVVVIDGSTLGASCPIRSFSPDAGQQMVVATAIIIYKMDTVDWSSTFGVFARVLLIGLILGSVLYFFIYKLMTYPMVEATAQLDQALRGEKDTVTTKFDFDVFQKLLGNINSAVSRMGKGPGEQATPIDRMAEASNLVRIVSDPAFALDGNGLFLQVNTAFEELIGMRLLTLQNQRLDVLQDQALKLNLEDLVQRGRMQMGNIITSDLEISGIPYEIDIQVSPDAQDPTAASYIFGTVKRRVAA